MVCCSKCGEKREYLLWRVDCLQCEGKTCPKCNKKKTAVFKSVKNVENCVCDLVAENVERKCSLCGQVDETNLKYFCPDCLIVNYGIKAELPKPIKNPVGKGKSIFSGTSFLVVAVVVVVVVVLALLLTAVVRKKQ